MKSEISHDLKDANEHSDMWLQTNKETPKEINEISTNATMTDALSTGWIECLYRCFPVDFYPSNITIKRQLGINNWQVFQCRNDGIHQHCGIQLQKQTRTHLCQVTNTNASLSGYKGQLNKITFINTSKNTC